jgi:hypothetical protein
MKQSQSTVLTDHAMLVVWGQFAHCLGLVQAIEQVALPQKTVEHSPQGKVLEFFVAILGGLEYLKDISLSARPLDKDLAVAQAWGQEAWADHSGVSRTLSSLTAAEVGQIAAILERLSQPFIDREVERGLASGPLILDGDLTPRPVSNGSRTYPEAEYGHMNDRLQLGYQAAIVSLNSHTYGRIGLSARQHSGKTVSATQAEELALEAERRLGRRPLRRIDLMAQRLEQLKSEGQKLSEKVADAQQGLAKAQVAQADVASQLAQAQKELSALEAAYAEKQRLERPHSYLSKTRQRVRMYQRRLERAKRSGDKVQQRLTRQQGNYTAWETCTTTLEKRMQRFQAENAANPAPIEAIFRLDAGFGTPENLTLLIEMGYEIYSKPYGNWLSGLLAEKSADPQDWQRVGANAEMKAWKEAALPDFPYPLDLGAVRFWQGDGYRHSALLHFGQRDVSADLPAWFHDYNARQMIEAGNKEAKQVFEIRHLKVRSRPALHLQEHFALFAANFVRFAALWLAEQCPQVPDGWKNSAQPQVKNQVKVGAHAPAQVEWFGQDCLVRFDERSVFAGRSFTVRRQLAIQLTLPWKFVKFSAF